MLDTIITSSTVQLPPGSILRMPGSWEDFERLEKILGDRSTPRIKYRAGEILLMAPLLEHGKQANIIANIAKVILEHRNLDYDAFAPITMKLPERSGIEPDYCFYIENWQAIQGKSRINWETNPPPDLVIEIDVTSYTRLHDYLPYQVPEIWLWKDNQLNIYRLIKGEYRIFPSIYYHPLNESNLAQLGGQCMQIAFEQNTSAAIKWLRVFLNK